MKAELGESLDHLRMAAAHAADGASGALAPRVESARKAVQPRLESGMTMAAGGLSSALDIARERSKTASKKAAKMKNKGQKRVAKLTGREQKSRRWPYAIGGLLVAGAAVGAAGAFLRRRRNESAWDEYGATRTTSDTDSVLGAAKNTMDAGIDKAKTMGEAAKDRASDLIGSKSTNTGPSAAGTGEYDKHPMPHTASKNSRS